MLLILEPFYYLLFILLFMYNLFTCYVLLIRSVSFVYHFKVFAKWQPQNMALDTSSHVCSSQAIDFNVMNDFLELDT